MDFNPVYFVNKLLDEAVEKNASDIHFHPHESETTVSYRVNGEMLIQQNIDKGLYEACLNRIKILANLGSSINNMPLDGRLYYYYQNLKRDLRISIIPCLYGESVVIRILFLKEAIPSLDKLGMNANITSKSLELLKLQEGMILTTGPTGSGKTTTLYALLKELLKAKPQIHIVSIEDPIEYQFSELTQIQVNEIAGLSFPIILRSVLRHDPDVILLGEIRDKETAEIAVRASLTGHLVLATLHTINAMGAINRFIEFGINPVLLADSLKAVYNQRLEKAKCEECLGKGCHKCFQKGYTGRVGNFELLLVDKDLQNKIREN